MVALPLLGVVPAWILDLDTVFVIGVVLLVSSQSRSTSNLLDHVAGLDHPLSLALRAFSNVFVFVTTPISWRLAQDAFG